MNVTCADRDRILMDGSAKQWSALEAHAANCSECGEELRIWKNLSSAADDLKQEWETPYLWPKIERSLTAQMAEGPSRWRAWLNSLGISGLQLQTAAALALLVVVTGTATWVYWQRDRNSDPHFLKSSAVTKVEKAEVEYQKAIDELATEARPQLEPPATPLMASYREKLLVLDNAIAELREEAGQNPANAHLRGQLLAMYQEKQDTLEEVLGAKK